MNVRNWYNIIEKKLEEFYSCSESFESYLREKWKNFEYICVFGVGNIGRPTVKILKEHHLYVDFYCDNDSKKWGKKYDGIKCLSVRELGEIKHKTLIIICGRAYKEIYKQLDELGYPYLDRIFVNKFAIREYLQNCNKDFLLKNIRSILDICADEQSKKVVSTIILEWLNNESGSLEDICIGNQYFCEEIVKLNNNEKLVDCGAYNGDTLNEFLQIKGNNFDRLILFELSKNNYLQLSHNVYLLDDKIKNKITLYNKGVSDRSKEIWYEELDEGSSEEHTGTTKGHLTTIDEICEKAEITYIKMDIEGSEMAALRGAKDTITKNKPKLAICLYHKPQDIWEIPIYIKKILPECKIYIRHHTDLLNETVCYAII